MSISGKSFTVDVFPQLVTVEINPEMASRSNPGGEVRRERYFACITNEDGDRWVHHHGLESLEACERLCDRIKERLDDGESLNSEYWREERPEYGSKAYLQYGAQNDMEWERAAG